MSDDLAGRVRSAAIAAWWTVLLASLFMGVQWILFQHTLKVQPEWAKRIWGGDLDWATLQTIGIWMTAIFKLFIWMAATVALWLSLWGRRLRRQG